jgi:hypothetical protein
MLAPLLLLALEPIAAASSFGLSVDGAIPSGAAVGMVLRPVQPLSVGVAATTHGAGAGGRVDVNLRAPFNVAPAVNVEAGWYPTAKVANGTWMGLPDLHPVERVGYRYGSARVGLDFGRSWAVVNVQAGVTYLVGNVNGGVLESEDAGLTLRWDPVTVRAWVPSARVGIVFWLND